MIKTLTNLLKQDKEKFVVPKGVQDCIPITAIYDDGIFRVGKDKYSKSFKFTDINFAVLPGTKRFGELKKSIGSVSQKVLTAQLRDMEENGLVNRKVYAEVPPRVEYSLTELGQSLKPILDAMWSWGEDYKEKCNK